LLRDWVDQQAFRRDRDNDGAYDDEAAVALMERDNRPGAMGCAYQKGYYGYLQRVLEPGMGRKRAPPIGFQQVVEFTHHR
jgi:hypothetical protein